MATLLMPAPGARGADVPSEDTTADGIRCLELAPAFARRLASLRQRCERHATRGQSSKAFERCEARAIAAYGRRLARQGCRSGPNDTSPEERMPTPTGSWVGLARIGGAIQEVEAAVVDGIAVLDGDISLGAVDELNAVQDALEDEVAAADLFDPTGGADQRMNGAASAAGGVRVTPRSGTVIARSALTWPLRTIPFVIDMSGAPDSTRRTTITTAIQLAIAHWNANSLFQLRQRRTGTSAEGDFVRFVWKDDLCRSPVGRQGGAQLIEVDDGCSQGNVIHEIGHAIGLYHEHTRLDRNRWVTVNWRNIQSDKTLNFQQFTTASGVDRLRFDFNSIMIYGPNTFSNGSGPTLSKVGGGTWTAQRTALSDRDIAGAALLAAELARGTRLKNDATGTCLRDDGEDVEAVVCKTDRNQHWFPTQAFTQDTVLVNAETGRCLGVDAGGGTFDAPCTNSTTVRFRHIGTTDGKYAMYESRRLANRCLSIVGGSVRVETCSQSGAAGLRQLWFKEERTL
jgi:hypothetical protein